MISEDTFKKDRIIHVFLEEERKVPLRLRVNKEGITFSAELIEGQRPDFDSLELLIALDERLHELGIPEKPGKDIRESHRLIISFQK